jgi:hypothetical protein
MSKEAVAEQPKNQLSLVVVSQNITTGLQSFENRKAELITLKEEVEGLKIQSLEDKAGIKQVTEARKKLKSARVEIEKEGKAMRDPLTAISKTISAKENELVAIIEPTEKELKKQEDWIKAEEKRLEEESAEKERQRIQTRIDRLANYGYQIDYNMLISLGDDYFERIVANAKVEYDREQAAVMEREKQEQAAREQAEKDRQELQVLRQKAEEAERIIREREEEVARKEAEIKRKEDEDRVVAERKAEKEMKDARFEPRALQLRNMGFVRYGPDFSLEDTWSTYWEQVYNMDDAEWPLYIKDIEDAIERRKVRVAEELKKQADALESARLKGIEQAKQEAERKIAEEAERIAQASDREKFDVILVHLEGCPYPDMKSAKHKKLLAEVKDLTSKVIAHIKAKA